MQYKIQVFVRAFLVLDAQTPKIKNQNTTSIAQYRAGPYLILGRTPCTECTSVLACFVQNHVLTVKSA